MNIVSLATWPAFRNWVTANRQIMPTYWRGQFDPEWPLASSFERTILGLSGGHQPRASQIYPYDDRYRRNGQPVWSPDFYRSMRDRYLQMFKHACAGLRGPNPANLPDDEWWALGRHYGLVTPLLDWSESPYIAAFFALSELLTAMRGPYGISFSGRSVAIYQLFHNEQLEDDRFRIVRPKIQELDRMHRQRGLFSWLDSEEFFDLQSFLDNTGRGDHLTKLILSDQAVLEGLRDLREHGIDYRLFDVTPS